MGSELDQAVSQIRKVNLAESFTKFHDQWSPKVAGDLNDSHVKVVKVQGEFVWHSHENEDELFLVVKGALTIKLRDRDIDLREGEFVIIPRGIEHKPVALEEAHVVPLEPKTTLNTGNVRGDMTVDELERL